MEHRDLTEKIIGIYYDVYNSLGYGFLESIYKNSMLIALRKAGLQADSEQPITVRFEGEIVGDFRADIVVEDKVIFELKCGKGIDPIHIAQTLNYLKASQINVGLVLNFGPKPQFERLFFNR